MNELPVLPENLTNISPFLEWLDMPIESDLDAQVATDRMGEIAVRKKQMDAFREEFIRPQKRILASFEEKCRNAMAPFEAIDKALRTKLGAYMDKVRKKKQEEFEIARHKELEAKKEEADRLAKEAFLTGNAEKAQMANLVQTRVNTLDNPNLVHQMRQTVRTGDTTVSQALVWKWQVEDITKVPEEWLIVDAPALDRAARSYNQKPIAVSGIRFYQETRVGVSRAK